MTSINSTFLAVVDHLNERKGDYTVEHQLAIWKQADAALRAELKAIKDKIDELKNCGTADTLSRYELDALAQGNKINAIKSVRNRCNLGLKDAKDMVESAWAKHLLRQQA